MYKYETHLHTSPVSKCAVATVKESLEFYKALGYDGVFITNHFLDGNISVDRSLSYKEQINFYFADLEEGERLSDEVGIKVFGGVELSYKGTDFLVYGLDKEWYLEHPEIMTMIKSEELNFLRENGAIVFQAHPYREAAYINHIRLFPRNVDGVEVINASRPEADNRMADIYADNYGLLKIAGSDNHSAAKKSILAGIESNEPISSVSDFIEFFRNGRFELFTMENPLLPKES